MKNNYVDLTLYEFLDAITNKKIVYYITIKGEGESDEAFGDKQTLIDVLTEIVSKHHEDSDNPFIKGLERVINELREKDEYVFSELNDIEIYNYLDHITKGFDIERVKLVLWDIDVYYNMDFLERINEESMNEFKRNGWKIPIVEKHTEKLKSGKVFEIGSSPDYKKMTARTHMCASWNIDRAINMLKKKLNYKGKNEIPNINPIKNKFTKQQATDLHNGLCRAKLIQSGIDSFLYWFGVTDNRNNVKRLEWTGKSKSLLAYFIDKITDKYNLKHGEKRLIKPFEIMFNVTGLTSAINEYGNKTGQKPIGYEIIDELLK
jgi:hypothetical protein